MRSVVGIYETKAGAGVRWSAHFKVGFQNLSPVVLSAEGPISPHATVAASLAACALREVSLPFADLRKAAQAAPYEVEGQLPYDLDDAVVSSEPLETGADGSRLLVAVAPEPAVGEVVERFDAETEHPQVIVPEAYALYSFARRLAGKTAGSLLFADVRPERILLVALEGGHWRGTRTLTTGWNPKKTEKPPVSAISELRRTVQSFYFDEDAPPSGLVVVGEGMGPEDEVGEVSRAAIARALGVELMELDGFGETLAGLSGGESTARISTHAMAIGLALCALDGKRRINLRGGRYALGKGDDAEILKYMVHACIGLLLVLGVAWMDGLLRYYTAKAALADSKASLVSQYQQVFPDAVKVPDPVAQASAELKSMQMRTQMFGGSNITVLGYLNAVSAAIPKSITIDVLEFSVEGEKLRMEAEAKSFDAIDQIKGLLAALPEFSEVRVSDAKASARKNRVKFRVHITLTEGV